MLLSKTNYGVAFHEHCLVFRILSDGEISIGANFEHRSSEQKKLSPALNALALEAEREKARQEEFERQRQERQSILPAGQDSPPPTRKSIIPSPWPWQQPGEPVPTPKITPATESTQNVAPAPIHSSEAKVWPAPAEFTSEHLKASIREFLPDAMLSNWQILQKYNLHLNSKTYFVHDGIAESNWFVYEDGANHLKISNGYQTRAFDPDNLFSADDVAHNAERVQKNMVMEAMAKRLELLGRNLPLSHQDYEALFHGGLEQANTGTCSLIAPLFAMSVSPHFELMMRQSIRPAADGGWYVQMPLMSENGKFIRLDQADLQPQPNPNLGQPIEWAAGRIDKRGYLNPVNASLGYQLIEAAFIKNKFGTVNRLLAEADTPIGEFYKILGDNFNYNYPTINKYDVPLGKHTKSEDFLNAFDLRRNLAILATAPDDNGEGDIRSFMVDGVVFQYNHAYTLLSVDKMAKTVQVVNPWDTNKVITITYDQFMRAFSHISFAEVNYSKMLKNMAKINAPGKLA